MLSYIYYFMYCIYCLDFYKMLSTFFSIDSCVYVFTKCVCVCIPSQTKKSYFSGVLLKICILLHRFPVYSTQINHLEDSWSCNVVPGTKNVTAPGSHRREHCYNHGQLMLHSQLWSTSTRQFLGVGSDKFQPFLLCNAPNMLPLHW